MWKTRDRKAQTVKELRDNMLTKFKKKYIGNWEFYRRYLLLAIPMILQNAITNLVSFLDNIMVGQLGTEQMSGVAIVNQLIFVYNLAIFGAVSAASIFGAQYFGKGNHKGHMYSFRFKLYATLFVTGGAILLFLTKGSALISLYLTDTVGNGATDVALKYGQEYLAIMMVGLIPFAVNQSYATNIKETGQTFIPMLASFVAVGTNALLDYLMIFGIGPFPRMEIAGAALATGIGQVITLLVYLIYYVADPLPVKLHKKYLRPEGEICGKTYGIGIPATLNMALPSLLISALNSILAAYSQGYVLVLGVYYKLQTFIYLPSNGIIQGIRPLIGYNYGAGERKRVEQIYRLTLELTAGIMAAGTALCWLIPGGLIGLFTENPETITIGIAALHIISLGFILSAVSVTSSGALEALGRGMASLVISVMRYVAVIIPAAFVLSRIIGVTGVWWAFVCTESVTAMVAYVLYRKVWKRA